MKNILLKFCLPVLVLLAGAGCYAHKPRTSFDPRQLPAPPDYASLDNWAAHPAKRDSADRTPCPDLPDRQATAHVDVFFVHPTSLTGTKRGEERWNGDVTNAPLNLKTDGGAILFQASIFNGASRVFAPRYRQAHLQSFYGRDKVSAEKALALAYDDVKAAFRYYLEHWNQGRPFIIAGHSQGGLHGMNLLRDMVENTPLEKQLVAAYLVGWPVKNDFFKKLKPCQSPEETGCYCSWRTWNRSNGLRRAKDDAVVCTNPLNWSSVAGRYAPKSANRGAVIRPFCAVYPGCTDAEVYRGWLLSRKPKFPGSALFVKKNYHVGDLNLFYLNVRENAETRAQAFLKK